MVNESSSLLTVADSFEVTAHDSGKVFARFFCFHVVQACQYLRYKFLCTLGIECVDVWSDPRPCVGVVSELHLNGQDQIQTHCGHPKVYLDKQNSQLKLQDAVV